MLALLLTVGLNAAEPQTQIKEEYIEYAQEIAEDYDNVDASLLVSIIEKESKGNPKSTSKSGECKGLMQVKENTHYKRMQKLDVKDIYDEYSNILVGADLLNDLIEKYGLERGIMAYNGTPNAGNRLGLTPYAKTVLNRNTELGYLNEPAKYQGTELTKEQLEEIQFEKREIQTLINEIENSDIETIKIAIKMKEQLDEY